MNIGITGGSTLIVLGDREEVRGFFDRIFGIDETLSDEAKLVFDRLYRRYLRPSELAAASRLLSDVASGLPHEAREFHTTFMRSFDKCAESAVLNFEAFRESDGYLYEPVRLVVADLPQFSVEKARRLRDYDELVGDPFWMR